MAWTDIFTGNNAGLSTAQKGLGSLAGYSGNVGEQGTNAAMNYNQGILSGDPTQVAMTLAPEIKTLGEQAQQNKNTVSQFGNRGGGMNSVMAGLDDATRAKLIQLMGSLRQGASQNLQQMGTQNLGLAANDNADAAKIAQQQHENMMNGIFGKVLSGATGLLTGKGINSLAGFFKGNAPTTGGSDFYGAPPSTSSMSSSYIPNVPTQNLPL